MKDPYFSRKFVKDTFEEENTNQMKKEVLGNYYSMG